MKIEIQRFVCTWIVYGCFLHFNQSFIHHGYRALISHFISALEGCGLWHAGIFPYQKQKIIIGQDFNCGCCFHSLSFVFISSADFLWSSFFKAYVLVWQEKSEQKTEERNGGIANNTFHNFN